MFSITMEEKNFKKIITAVLVACLFILAVLIIKPVFYSIIWGVLLAYIFYPVYSQVYKRVKSKGLSSFIICLLLLAVIIIPLVFIFNTLINQAINGYLALQKIDLGAVFTKLLPPFLLDTAISEQIISSISGVIPTLISGFISKFGEFILNLPIILLQIFIVIFVFFFSLRDGEELIEYLKSLSPFTKETSDRFLNHMKDITNSVLIGQVVVGILQGILAGIGYFVFGVPYIIVLTVLTAFAAIIPLIGPWLIWVPVDIYLFSIGKTGPAIGLLIYGTIIVSLIDNVLRPFIVSKRTKLNSAIVVIGMIGGFLVFGILGFILGPLIIAYVLLVVEIYRKSKKSESLIFKNT